MSSLYSTSPVSPSPQTNSNDESDEDHPVDRPEVLQPGSESEMVSAEAECVEGDMEDCAPRVTVIDPGLPTEKELEDHKVDHLPYRSWCRECVESKAPAAAHKRDVSKKRRIPVVAFDYLDLHKDMQRLEGSAVVSDQPRSRIKVLIVKGSKAQFPFAHVVPQKGIDEKRFAVDSLVEDTRILG